MADPQLYERLYELEWERRNDVQQAATTPIGVLALLAGGLAVLVVQFRSDHWLLEWWFWLSIAGALIGFAVSAWFLARGNWGYMYQRVPYPSQIREYEERLDAYYRAENEPPGLAGRDFRDFLRAGYIQAGDVNAKNNRRRAEYVHRAVGALIVTLVATAGASVPYVIAARLASTDQAQHSTQETTNGQGLYERPAVSIPDESAVTELEPQTDRSSEH